MIRVEKIRRNNVTNTWEHWIDRSTDASEARGYWAEGLTGITGKMYEIVNDFSNRNFNGELMLYEDANNAKYDVRVRIVGVDKEAEQKIDKEISELIDNSEIEKLTPVILKNLSEIYGDEIMILNDVSTKFKVRASNPNPFTELDYFWYFDGDEVNVDSEDVLRVSFPVQTDAPLMCKVKNPSGETETDSITLKVLDPTENDFFGRNLIKNPDASEGLKYWETISGNPQVVPIWQYPTRYGYFNSSNWTVNPPDLDTELTGKYNVNYFHGGTAEDDNRIVQMVQEIDLSEIEDYIDRNIKGISSLTARLYGWLGAFGYLGGGDAENFKSNKWGEGWYYPAIRRVWDGTKFVNVNANVTTSDKVDVYVDFLDKNDVVLKTRRIRVDDTNHIQKVGLQSIETTIPRKTRSAKIRILFNKDMSQGVLYFRRYWEEYSALSHDHLTMATHLGLMINVNGRTDPYAEKFDDDGRFRGEIVYNEEDATPNPIGLYNKPLRLIPPEDPQYPQADFTSDVQDGEVYLTVAFQSQASNDSWGHLWDFGDGYTSTETNPVHTYKRVGNFKVTLTTQDETRELQNQISKENFIVTRLPDVENVAPRPRPTVSQTLINTSAQASSTSAS